MPYLMLFLYSLKYKVGNENKKLFRAIEKKKKICREIVLGVLVSYLIFLTGRQGFTLT